MSPPRIRSEGIKRSCCLSVRSVSTELKNGAFRSYGYHRILIENPVLDVEPSCHMASRSGQNVLGAEKRPRYPTKQATVSITREEKVTGCLSPCHLLTGGQRSGHRAR